jgi:hypothetical protein
MDNPKTSSQPVLDDRFTINIKGRDFVLYTGLLDLAHQKGLKGITVEAIQYPTKENGLEAICKAIVESKDGEEFIEIGDANPKNVASYIAEHVLRMAATRAKARALRDYVNVGMTCLEELGDLDDVIGNNGAKSAAPKKKATKRQPKAKPAAKKSSEKKPAKVTPISSDSPKMSTAQKTAILNLSKRRGINEEELDAMVQEAYAVSFDQLTSKDAAQFIRSLQQAA